MYLLKNAPWVLGSMGGFCREGAHWRWGADWCWWWAQVQFPLWRCLRGCNPAELTWAMWRGVTAAASPAPSWLSVPQTQPIWVTESKSPGKKLPLCWIFRHLMGLGSSVSLLGVVANCSPSLVSARWGCFKLEPWVWIPGHSSDDVGEVHQCKQQSLAAGCFGWTCLSYHLLDILIISCCCLILIL